MLRVLNDRVFAALALGALANEESRAILLPHLESVEPQVRWVSAISLGRIGEKRALRVLAPMLTELLPTSMEAYRAVWSTPDWIFENWRGYAPDWIGQLGEPLALPALRDALAQLIDLLGQRTFNPIATYASLALDSELRSLSTYQDSIVYAMGRLGGFGTLTGLPAAEPFSEVWAVHLTMGHLRGRYPPQDMMRWRWYPALEADIMHILLSRFALTPAAQEHALDHYMHAKLPDLQASYQEQETLWRGRNATS